MKILIENCRRNFKKPYVIGTVAELVILVAQVRRLYAS